MVRMVDLEGVVRGDGKEGAVEVHAEGKAVRCKSLCECLRSGRVHVRALHIACSSALVLAICHIYAHIPALHGAYTFSRQMLI